MFSIKTDAPRKLVRITISGMVTVEEVQQFRQQERAAVTAMGCRLGDHLALADLTGCGLQLQQVVAAFQQVIEARGQARRLALVTGDSVVRMQARRVINRPDAALFETIAEAEAWLFRPIDEESAPTARRAAG